MSPVQIAGLGIEKHCHVVEVHIIGAAAFWVHAPIAEQQ